MTASASANGSYVFNAGTFTRGVQAAAGAGTKNPPERIGSSRNDLSSAGGGGVANFTPPHGHPAPHIERHPLQAVARRLGVAISHWKFDQASCHERNGFCNGQYLT